MTNIVPPGPLAYEGQVVVSYINRTVDPTTSNFQFPIPTIWTNTVALRAFILVSKPQNVANWVLIGGNGGTTPVDSIQVDASTGPGTNPVLPTTLGLITVTGAQTAPGTIANVIRTDSLAANTYTTEIQQTSAVAAKDITKNGVSHFNSSHFSNDQGFISLSGGGQAIDTVTGNSGGQVGPAGTGNINIVGDATTFTLAGNPGTNTLTGNVILPALHSSLVSGSTSIVGKGPNASTNSIFMSNGVSADPDFTTTGVPYAAGISFDAGANILDFYVEGNFIPTLAFGGASVGITYVDQIGRFTLIGDKVFFNMILKISSKGSSTGVATFAGFPYAPDPLEVNISIAYFDSMSLTAGMTSLALQFSGGAFQIFQIGAASTSNAMDTNFTNGSNIKFNGFYSTNDA